MDERAELIRELVASGISPFDAEAWLGPMQEIAELVDLFQRSPEARLIMTIARRGRMPYSEAEYRWTDLSDRLKEIAWDVTMAEESKRECPECGIDHDDVRDPVSGAVLQGGRYKLRKVDCWVTAEKDRATKNRLTDEERAEGVRFQLAIREPGDPWIDDSPDLEEA